MYRILKLASFLVILASNAAAEDRFFWDDNITADYIKNLEVRVALGDNATGACWTNLKEVREYAEEKLRTFGVKVSQNPFNDAKENIYWLRIEVNAKRVYEGETGPCLGYYRLSLRGWVVINNVMHFATLGERAITPFISASDTFNRPVFVGLEKVFAAFPE